jgi:hypothetical protein
MIEQAPSLDYVGEATPYIYLGDSHALIGTLLFEEPQSGRRIATATYTAWGFSARDVFDKTAGLLAPTLIDLLRRCASLHSSYRYSPIPGFPTVRAYEGEQPFDEILQVAKLSDDRPHVLCVGELDVRRFVKTVSEDGIDFTLPFAAEAVDELPSAPIQAHLPFGQVLNYLLETIGPVLRGIRALREGGLRTLYLHSLPPPSLDVDAMTDKFGYSVSLRAYYKLVMLVNFIYRRACAEIGIGFIDTWSAVTEQNLRKPEYGLDIVHLNRAHTILSVQEVHRQFTSIGTAV